MTNAPDDEITAIAAIREALEAAENAGDADAAVALLADDAVVMVPDFPIQEGKDACAAFMRDIMPALFTEFDRHATYSSAEISVRAPKYPWPGTWPSTAARSRLPYRHAWAVTPHR